MAFFITFASMVTAVLFTGVLLAFLYPVSPRGARAVCSTIPTYLAPLIFRMPHCYLGFRIYDEPYDASALPEQFLVVSNHQSLLDIPLYMCYFSCRHLRFVAKAELGRYVPAVSEMLRVEDHCLIPRENNMRLAMRRLDKFARQVGERGQVPVIFPEGHRSRDGKLHSFGAAGVRRILDTSPMPVVICALDGGYRIGNLSGIFRNMKNGAYRIKVLKIYPTPQNKQDQLHILEESRMLIQNQLNEWRGQLQN
jgi:1-acyl-sn-glycerol-3-phosphate acyltransferase